MPVIYQHGSRENGHGSASQCWQGKEQQRNSEWVQSAQVTSFMCGITREYAGTSNKHQMSKA